MSIFKGSGVERLRWMTRNIWKRFVFPQKLQRAEYLSLPVPAPIIQRMP